MSILVDFERASKKAIEEAFPNAKIYGCYFHFSQCLFRKLQKLGLKTLYENNLVFRKKIKFLKALAFIPEIDVLDVLWDLIFYLRDGEDDEAMFEEFFEYFLHAWISDTCYNDEHSPGKLKLNWWNCYELVLISLPKTNNVIEARNRHFNIQLPKNPNIWKFLETLKKEIQIAF